MPIRNLNLLSALVLGAVLLPATLMAQNTMRQLITRYSPAVVNRIYMEYTSKMTLSESAQWWLAEQYNRQDSLVAAYILAAEKDAAAVKKYTDSLSWAIEIDLKKMMTVAEQKTFATAIESQRAYPIPVLNEQIIAKAEMNSQFGAAYKLKDKLELTVEQEQALFSSAEQLRTKLDYHQSNPDSGFFDKAAFESAALSKILSEKQYNTMLAEKNKRASELQARYDWYSLRSMGLAEKFEQKTALQKMTVFYLLRAHITDRFANEKEKQSALLRALNIPEPIKALRQGKATNKSQLAKYAW